MNNCERVPYFQLEGNRICNFSLPYGKNRKKWEVKWFQYEKWTKFFIKVQLTVTQQWVTVHTVTLQYNETMKISRNNLLSNWSKKNKKKKKKRRTLRGEKRSNRRIGSRVPRSHRYFLDELLEVGLARAHRVPPCNSPVSDSLAQTVCSRPPCSGWPWTVLPREWLRDYANATAPCVPENRHNLLIIIHVTFKLGPNYSHVGVNGQIFITGK